MPSTFHIRDRQTGLFLHAAEVRPQRSSRWNSPYQTDEEINEWLEPGKAVWNPLGEHRIAIFHIKGWGKAFKDMGKLKTHLNMLLGIFTPPNEYCYSTIWGLPRESVERREAEERIDAWHRMHPGYRNVPEYMDNYHPIPAIPDTWEVVEVIDKRANETRVVDFDPADYGRNALRLRKVTDTYGSAVKAVYKKLETKGIESFPYVVAVAPDFDHLMRNRSFWDLPAYKPDPAKVVDIVVRCVGSQREVVRASAEFSTALAFKNVSGALMFKMAYDGEDTGHVVTVLDARTLEEVATPSLTEDA